MVFNFYIQMNMLTCNTTNAIKTNEPLNIICYLLQSYSMPCMNLRKNILIEEYEWKNLIKFKRCLIANIIV